MLLLMIFWVDDYSSLIKFMFKSGRKAYKSIMYAPHVFVNEQDPIHFKSIKKIIFSSSTTPSSLNFFLISSLARLEYTTPPSSVMFCFFWRALVNYIKLASSWWLCFGELEDPFGKNTFVHAMSPHLQCCRHCTLWCTFGCDEYCCFWPSEGAWNQLNE